MPARFSASAFFGQAISSGCTWINVVPTMISYLLEGEAPRRERTRAIRFCRSASSALPPVPDGTTGEIVIRGPHVMRGYYKNDKATADAFTPDGWLRTGDLGHRDADGFFFVTGRIKELIIKGGENIAPREIDEALLQHPAVLEAAAVGIPDKHYGQEILACIVPREGMPCTEADLRAFCLEKLGRYKTPGVFRFVTELPRGPSGKVQRLKLAQA
jgi:acyl-CoA synthetase (AMP-forming)/AMP-acid ligase II